MLYIYVSKTSNSRMLGAFRLHRGVGPVIINMSRISVDLFFMSWIYVFLTLAWTLGLVHIRNNKSWIKQLDVKNNGKNKSGFSRSCHQNVWSGWPVYEVKCLCSRGQE